MISSTFGVASARNTRKSCRSRGPNRRRRGVTARAGVAAGAVACGMDVTDDKRGPFGSTRIDAGPRLKRTERDTVNQK